MFDRGGSTKEEDFLTVHTQLGMKKMLVSELRKVYEEKGNVKVIVVLVSFAQVALTLDAVAVLNAYDNPAVDALFNLVGQLIGEVNDMKSKPIYGYTFDNLSLKKLD